MTLPHLEGGSVNCGDKRPALGQEASLGRLYDANSDKVLSNKFLRTEVPPPGSFETSEKSSISFKHAISDSLQERYSNLGASADVSASLLCGSINAGWRADYLSSSRRKSRVLQASVVCTVHTRYEYLNLGAHGLEGNLNFSALDTAGATHVICGIVWGAQTSVTVRVTSAESSESRKFTSDVGTGPKGEAEIGRNKSTQSLLSRIVNCIGQVNLDGKLSLDDETRSRITELDFSISGDAIDDFETTPRNVEEFIEFLHKIPSSFKAAREGKAVPIEFELRPIDDVAREFKRELTQEIISHRLETSCVNDCVELLEELEMVCQELQDYYDRLEEHSYCIPKDHIRKVKGMLGSSKKQRSEFLKDMTGILCRIRKESADISELEDCFAQVNNYKKPTNYNETIDKYCTKMAMASQLRGLGAIYVKNDQFEIQSAIHKPHEKDLFVLHYNEETRGMSDWPEHFRLAMQLLYERDLRLMIVDHDVGVPDILEKPLLEQFRGGRLLVDDVVASYKELSDKCIIRCDDPSQFQPFNGTIAPLSRRVVRISCPGPNCHESGKYVWTCAKCRRLVCYGVTDDFIYCSCGRYPPSQSVFKCKNITHGPEFSRYQETTLQELLKDLDESEVYNVLVMGETGTGKSTFINAFVNYANFESLEEALNDTEVVRFAVPSALAHEIEGGEMVDVTLGESTESEILSRNGQSATQRGTIYSLEMDNGKSIRLIDTPGIGDSRGIRYDDANIKDILTTLEQVDKLSAILILLRPSQARLTPTFRFCLIELFRHLHRSAVRNVIFGFTFASGTQYKAGVVERPLNELLRSLNVGLILGQGNKYFFDSGWFAYLAACKKKGRELPGKDCHEEMWRRSAEETGRFIATVMQLPTHNVGETLNYNRIRNVLERMAKPLTSFSSAMKKSQVELQALRENLAALDETDKDLAEKLKKFKLTMTVPVRYNLKRAMMVCSEEECSTYMEDEEGRRQRVFNPECHSDCDLRAPTEFPGHSDMRGCYAFRGWLFWYGYPCYKCKHPWEKHMLVSYRFNNEKRLVEDKDIKGQIQNNEDAKHQLKVKLDLAQDTIEEIEKEAAQIKDAQAYFGFYLKDNGVVTYNDATTAHLAYQIRNAELEGRGADAAELRQQYSEYGSKLEELMKLIAEGGERRPGALKMDEIIEGLKAMKTFGQYLSAALDQSSPVVLENRLRTVVCTPKKKWSLKAGWKYLWGE